MKITQYVALFRGINVGRAKRVAMAELRALIEGLGYGDVRSLLNSGNVVFSASAAAAGNAASRIEESLATKLGVSARVTLLTAAELAGIVVENPMLGIADDPSRLLVAVLSDSTDRAKLEPLLEQDWAPDALAIGRRVAYVWCSGGILESRPAQAVGRALGNAATTRNWATILKLHALMHENT
ncbi:MAG: DUF1697 domain-containing protein [Isosphaeraceae bacterium]